MSIGIKGLKKTLTHNNRGCACMWYFGQCAAHLICRVEQLGMSKVETQFTAAITAFTVFATASAVLSLGFFVHVNKRDDHDKDKDLDFCVLFMKELSANGIKGACDFIISGEAIILALLLTAIGSIAVSICLSTR